MTFENAGTKFQEDILFLSLIKYSDYFQYQTF